MTERSCDEAFSSRLQQLSAVMKRRTAVYSAEEKALMVMLEGEQEEERRREQEKRGKKERERQLQRKRRADAMMFGGNSPWFNSSMIQSCVCVCVLRVCVCVFLYTCVCFIFYVSQMSFLPTLCCSPSDSITPRPSALCTLCYMSGWFSSSLHCGIITIIRQSYGSPNRTEQQFPERARFISASA